MPLWVAVPIVVVITLAIVAALGVAIDRSARE